PRRLPALVRLVALLRLPGLPRRLPLGLRGLLLRLRLGVLLPALLAFLLPALARAVVGEVGLVVVDPGGDRIAVAVSAVAGAGRLVAVGHRRAQVDDLAVDRKSVAEGKAGGL